MAVWEGCLNVRAQLLAWPPAQGSSWGCSRPWPLVRARGEVLKQSSRVQRSAKYRGNGVEKRRRTTRNTTNMKRVCVQNNGVARACLGAFENGIRRDIY